MGYSPVIKRSKLSIHTKTWSKKTNYSSPEASLIDHLVKNPLAMKENWILFLAQEDPLEKEMATHSSILAWRSPWTEEPGRLRSVGSQELDMT